MPSSKYFTTLLLSLQSNIEHAVRRLYLLGWLIRNLSVIHCYFSSHTDRLFSSWSLLSLCSIYLSPSLIAYVCGQLIGWRKARTGRKRCNQLRATVISSDKCNNATHHLKLMIIRFRTILNLKYNKPFTSFSLKFQQISSKNTVCIIIK